MQIDDRFILFLLRIFSIAVREILFWSNHNPQISSNLKYHKQELVIVSAPHLANPTIKPRCYSGKGGGFYP